MTAPLSRPDLAAIVVAAGSGSRSGLSHPKQFAAWRGKPLVRHSVEALRRAGAARIVVVIAPGTQAAAEEALAGLACEFADGGATRQQSVAAGLAALCGDPPEFVLVHDAARPGLPLAVIERLLAALETADAAIPVLRVIDSLAYADGAAMGDCAPRDALRRVQTPQAFRFAAIRAAHAAWPGAPDAGDDAQVARAAGIAVTLVDGDEALHKVTMPEDFAVQSPAPSPVPAIRVGMGYDVHRLAVGEELWLCGIKIDHDQGLTGHSDADVAIHALVDALLGAVASGDIGEHFPPSDARWKGASSDQFLAHAIALIAARGYAPVNVDLTIVCEAPRIGPHRAAMRARLAAIMGLDIDAVSVKATTTERLGFAGRGEGIAAQAVATVARI